MARQLIPTTGLWSAISALLNANFTELYQAVRTGIYDYNDAVTATTPISIAVADTWYDITNDGAGAFTNKTYAFPDIADIWNTSTNQFDFSSLALGDTVDIRLDVEVTTNGANQDVDIDLVLAVGQAGEYRIPFIVEQAFKTAGTRQIIRFNGIYMGDANTRDNPAKFQIRSDGTGSVKVNGWYVRVNRRAQEIA